MIKQVLKEIIIILLLTLVILLIMGVLFYDYNPANKVVPNKVAYTTPDNIKEELEEASVDNETISVEDRIYKVEGADLNVYKKNNTYNPSKQNPYANTITGSSGTNASGENANTEKTGTTENAGSTTTNTTGNNTKNRLK